MYLKVIRNNQESKVEDHINVGSKSFSIEHFTILKHERLQDFPVGTSTVITSEAFDTPISIRWNDELYLVSDDLKTSIVIIGPLRKPSNDKVTNGITNTGRSDGIKRPVKK